MISKNTKNNIVDINEFLELKEEVENILPDITSSNFEKINFEGNDEISNKDN